MLFFCFLSSFIYYGCKKKDSTATCSDGIQNQSETAIDCGGPCLACATCSDGIQNQNETGVDCGGPCTACTTVLCDGNGKNTYYPLAINNNWKYIIQGASFDYSLIVKGTKMFNSLTYFELEGKDISSSSYLSYLRIAANGDIYNYNPSGSVAEELEVPANPTVNQTWPYYVGSGIGTRKVISINATLTTAACSYTGCLQIKTYFPDGTLATTYYYKKGIGMVSKFEFGSTNLNKVTLY